MITYKCFLNFDKEEKWLEQMSENGYHLEELTAFGAYKFKKGVPEKRKYKMDFRVFNNNEDLRDYVALFEDSGWKCAFSKVRIGGHYFYTSEEKINEDIFSDEASKAQRYIRLSKYFVFYGMIISLPYFTMFMSGSIKFGNLTYLTPGLWDMKGLRFLAAFLFETPFVIMRSFTGVIPLVFIIIMPLFFYSLGKYKSLDNKKR